MPGGLLFWTLYYSGLGAFEGGTLCERVLQALFVRAVVQKMLLFEGFGFEIFLVKRRQTEQRDKAAGVPGSLLFWILYYFGLEAFKGGTLCERVQQAFLAGVVVQKMLLFEGFGFEIFLVRRRQLTEQRHKAPDSAWRFMILDPLLFWVGGLQRGYPL